MSEKPTQSKEDKHDTNAITEQFLLGELIKAVAVPFQSLSVPWLKMSEEEQTKFRANIIERASDAVKKAVTCIATGDRVNFRATCEQVQFKADGVKAALTLYNSPEAHALADVAGGTVLIVIEDGGRYLGTGDSIQPQPDNKPLFDDKPVPPAKSTNVIDVTAKTISHQTLASDLEQAYGDGNLAAQEGKPQSDCPIMAGDLCIAWVKGWKAWHEENPSAEPVKTAKLGELPNDAGVYVCEPDETDKWEYKKHRASYSLIELENGKWVYGVTVLINDGGSTFAPSINRIVHSRDEGIEEIRDYFELQKADLSGKALESFTEFVDWLGQEGGAV